MVELKPFTPIAEKISLQADIQLTNSGLSLSFDLHDPNSLVQKSLQVGNWQASSLKRADDLWKETCFEAFWSRPGEKSYWELNLSPAGKWNLYFFEDYRKPQPPQKSSDFSLEDVITTPNSLRCFLQTKIEIPSLDISICSVIKTAANTFYYSTAHKGEKPDFHLRESFILRRNA